MGSVMPNRTWRSDRRGGLRLPALPAALGLAIAITATWRSGLTVDEAPGRLLTLHVPEWTVLVIAATAVLMCLAVISTLLAPPRRKHPDDFELELPPPPRLSPVSLMCVLLAAPILALIATLVVRRTALRCERLPPCRVGGCRPADDPGRGASGPVSPKRSHGRSRPGMHRQPGSHNVPVLHRCGSDRDDRGVAATGTDRLDPCPHCGDRMHRHHGRPGTRGPKRARQKCYAWGRLIEDRIRPIWNQSGMESPSELPAWLMTPSAGYRRACA